MPRKLDPAIADVLKSHGFGPDACWDCHGTWVVYHRILEQIAAKAEIQFGPPQVLEANGVAKSVALCVTGSLGSKVEWSVGEAAPGNNKNNYPYAMAEKRAKDRVILKLIGLHGLVYSEDEMDGASNATLDNATIATDMMVEIKKITNPDILEEWGHTNALKANNLDEANRGRVRGAFSSQLKALRAKAAA